MWGCWSAMRLSVLLVACSCLAVAAGFRFENHRLFIQQAIVSWNVAAGRGLDYSCRVHVKWPWMALGMHVICPDDSACLPSAGQKIPPTTVAQHPAGSAGRRWRWAALVTAAAPALKGRWRCPQAPCLRCMCGTCAGQHMFGGKFSRALGSAGSGPRWYAHTCACAPCPPAGVPS